MLSTPVSPDGKPGDTRSKWQRGEAAAERVRQDLEGERHRGGGRELAHVEEMSSKRSRWGGGHGRTARTCEDAGPSLRKGQTPGKHRLAAVAWEAQ